jgi:hypothetical protein
MTAIDLLLHFPSHTLERFDAQFGIGIKLHIYSIEHQANWLLNDLSQLTWQNDEQSRRTLSLHSFFGMIKNDSSMDDRRYSRLVA